MDSDKLNVLVDALPYIDQGYNDPGVREAAFLMVEEECRRYRPTKNYLEHLPSLATSSFETDLMKNEFERLSNRQPLEPLSMKRYELPPPPSGRLGEVQAWNESVENSMAQLEHQGIRAMNLELMLNYGCEAWKQVLEVFTAMQAKAQDRLQDLKKEIQDVNWERKERQTEAGEKLKQLEIQWVTLVSKNYEIEQVCAKLEEEIQQHKSKKRKFDEDDVATADKLEEQADDKPEEAHNEQEMAAEAINDIFADNNQE